MGLDPEHPDYEAGDKCVLCWELLFNDITPKYVEADITGIDRCPIAFGTTPDGTYLLTQVAPCVWNFLDGEGRSYNWSLNAGNSRFTIEVPGFSWFGGSSVDDCIDAFVNRNTCGMGPILGENGYALLYWGPTIGP